MAVQVVDGTGRTGYHIHKIKYGKDGAKADRRNLLRHHMRNLDPDDVEHFSKQNTNIATEYTHENWDWVNTGGEEDETFLLANSVDEVLEYGDARIARAKNIKSNQVAFLNVNVYFPVTMCTPEKTTFRNKAGEEIEGERWIVEDKEEAQRYITSVVKQFAEELPGGMDAIHGVSVNFDETRPHLTIIADSLAENEKGELTVAYSHAFGTHKSVVYPEDHEKAGRVISGTEKLRDMQQRLRDRIADDGFDVERTAGGKGGIAHDAYKELSFERAKTLEGIREVADRHIEESKKAKAEEQKAREEAEKLKADMQGLAEDLFNQVMDEHRQKTEELKAERDVFIKTESAKMTAERKQFLDEARSEAEEIRKSARDEALRSAQAEAERIRKEAEERALEREDEADRDRSEARRALREAEQKNQAAERKSEELEKKIADFERALDDIHGVQDDLAAGHKRLGKLIEAGELTIEEKRTLAAEGRKIREEEIKAEPTKRRAVDVWLEEHRARQSKKPASRGYDGPEF